MKKKMTGNLNRAKNRSTIKAPGRLAEPWPHNENGLSRTGDTLLEEYLYRVVIRDFPEFLAMIGPDGLILLMNDAFLKAIGRGRDEVVGKEYLTDFIPENDHGALAKLFGSFGPTPGPARVETGLICGSGEVKTIEWHGHSILDNQRQVLYCVGNDVTEARRGTEELRRTKEYLENVLENSPDAIGIVDAEGRFIKMNRAAETLYGYSPGELNGKNAFELYADKDRLRSMLRILKTEGAVRNHEIDMKKKDGSVVPFEMSISLLSAPDGAMIGSVSVARNLSEIKKALNSLEAANDRLEGEIQMHAQTMEALRKSRRQYRTIFESTGNATIIFEEDSTISLCNTEFAKISGYSKDEIEGKKSWTEFFSDESLPAMREFHRLRRIDPHAAPKDYEARFKNAKGQHKDMFLTVSIMPDTNASVASLLDITERKKVEQELRLSHEELEQRSYEISLLNEMINLLQVCSSGEESYYVLGNYVQRLFPSDSGSLYLLKESTTQLEAAFSWGGLCSGEKVFDYEDCWALRQGKVHVVEEPGGVLCKHLNETPAAGCLCIPMIAQGEVIGLFHLRCNPSDAEHPETHRKILYLKQRLATAIADHIGLGLANLKMRERLRTQSIKDPLTGLYNRRFMEESLNRELYRAKRQASPLAAIMLDVDHFKAFNDNFGHEAGDILLAEVGGLLAKSVRAEDIVCRYGGEEFLIILAGDCCDEAEKRAEVLRSQVKNLKVSCNGTELGPVTVSLGVAVYGESCGTVKSILNAADRALYAAKNLGRDRVVVA